MMPDGFDEDVPTCTELIMGHIHDLLEGGHLVTTDVNTITTDDGKQLPMTLVGISYDDTVVSYFALALNPALIELLDVKRPLCQACIDEQASAILDDIDLDADLENLQHNHPHDQPEE